MMGRGTGSRSEDSLAQRGPMGHNRKMKMRVANPFLTVAVVMLGVGVPVVTHWNPLATTFLSLALFVMAVVQARARQAENPPA